MKFLTRRAKERILNAQKRKKRLIKETNNNLGSFRFLNSSAGIQNMKEKLFLNSHMKLFLT